MPAPLRFGTGFTIQEGSGASPGNVSQISVITISLNKEMMKKLAAYLEEHVRRLEEQEDAEWWSKAGNAFGWDGQED